MASLQGRGRGPGQFGMSLFLSVGTFHSPTVPANTEATQNLFVLQAVHSSRGNALLCRALVPAVTSLGKE